MLEYSSGGTIGGNAAQHVFSYWPTADGSSVFFVTSEALTADDTDTQQDIYEHVVGGPTNLISTGPAGGNGAFPADFNMATSDGSHVVFRTKEQLVTADTDTQDDIYDATAGTVDLISTSSTNTFTCDGQPGNAFAHAISTDGTKVLFQANDRLVPEDTDCSYDTYVRSGGTTTLASKGSLAQATGSFDSALPVDMSADGTIVYFTTAVALEPADTDASVDVYRRAGGVTTLESIGPDGGSGAFGVIGYFVSDDGGTLYFTTAESLVVADTDSSTDIYVRSGGTTSLVSGGNGSFAPQFVTATANGAHAVFSTAEPLVAADTDTRFDLYEYAGGAVQLVSTGPAGGNGAFDAGNQVQMSQDGSHIFFGTSEKLSGADTDTQFDLYDRFGGTTALVSPGTGNFFSQLGAITPDAGRIFFSTNERLVGADTDSLSDLYERAGNEVTLISPAHLGGNTSFGPFAQANGASQDGSRIFFTTGESYDPADTDSVSDVYVASTAGGPPAPGYPRPKSASPLQLSLVPAYQPCTSPNRTHGPPLAFGSCNPPARASGNLTVGTPDANGQAPASIGTVRFSTVVGVPATMADEADVNFTFSMTDVRVASTLADYTGELQSTATVRITDKRNGTGVDSGTVQDLPFPATVPCTATTGTAGATCAVTTTFDAVLPGAIAESRRSIWEFDQVRVMDGGSDGLAATTPNDLFATQGIFVP